MFNRICSRFNPTDKRTEITYRQNSDDSVYRVTKGMSETILSMCTRGKTSEIVKQFNMDIDEFAERGLRALAVAMERVHDDQGEGFELIGLLPIYDPPRDDTKLTIERAIELGKMNFRSNEKVNINMLKRLFIKV